MRHRRSGSRRARAAYLLRGLAQSLHREAVAAEVDARLLAELGEQMLRPKALSLPEMPPRAPRRSVNSHLEELLVKILTAEHRVAIGRLDLEDAATDL